MSVHACVRACVHVFLHVTEAHTHTHTHTNAHTNTRAHIQVRVNATSLRKELVRDCSPAQLESMLFQVLSSPPPGLYHSHFPLPYPLAISLSVCLSLSCCAVGCRLRCARRAVGSSSSRAMKTSGEGSPPPSPHRDMLHALALSILARTGVSLARAQPGAGTRRNCALGWR